MSCDTIGKIRGYISIEDIFEFVKEKWDKDAKLHSEKSNIMPLSKISEVSKKYKLNQHGESNECWYIIRGYIDFFFQEEGRRLFYDYSNVNFLENHDFYSQYELTEMVESETTNLLLGHDETSSDMMETLVWHFGGGWVDEDDLDEIPFCDIANFAEKEVEKKEYYAVKTSMVFEATLLVPVEKAEDITEAIKIVDDAVEDCKIPLLEKRAVCKTKKAEITNINGVCRLNKADAEKYRIL